MAKSRKATPIIITTEQREQLERLWFYFGNYGPKTTPGNHSFIQRLLENGIDERPLYTKRTPQSEIPTPECEGAVEAILSTPGANHLRIIKNPVKQKSTELDPKSRAVLDDLNCRYRVKHKRLETERDTPDAA